MAAWLCSGQKGIWGNAVQVEKTDVLQGDRGNNVQLL